MERREFLAAAAGSLATGLFSREAFASSGTVNSNLVFSDKDVLKQLAIVAKTANDCVAAGNACVQHCQEELIAGNGKEFADCSIAVHQMISVCENTANLAAYKAKVLADFVEGCIKACETCRVACKEHESHFAHGMHLACRNCMQSCIACIKACQDLKALILTP